ncbi:MAG: hypothetical protein IPK32_04280 [Verrucomicrobiaceae bacterium]|nr:hypothetical protein [Verrucomicrobiaceae bacterium]
MVTNFFPIKFPFSEFDVQRVNYSYEKLKELRTRYNSSSSFFRHGDHIYISPRKGEDLSLGDVIRLQVAQHTDVLSSMVRHLLFRTFRDAFPALVPEDFAPLRFPSRKKEHDPMQKLLSLDLAKVVQFPRINEVHVRSILEKDQPRVGLLVVCRHRWRMGASLTKLQAEGFNLVGCSVLESIAIPGLEGVLAPDESLLGEIEEIQGDMALVRTNSGIETRPLDALVLQRTHEQIGRYLESQLGATKVTAIFRRLRDLEGERVKAGAHYFEVTRVADWFSQQTYENADGFTFSVERSPTLASSTLPLEPTKLVFDYSPGAAASRPLSGLSKFGPFDSSRFDRKRPRILAIFHHRNHGAATKFLAQLIDGIPTSSYFKKGLRDLFRLHEVDYAIKEINASFPEDYERAIDDAVKEAGSNKFELALVECPVDSASFPAAQNPYYRAKARLMSYGISVQCVRQEHLRMEPRELAWTLGPTALQIYAKLGGIPWLLPGSQSVDAELVVGIGNTIQRPNLWSGAEQSRVVGLTTFFLGDGRYLMGQELKSVPYAEYFGQLLHSLEESLKFVSMEYAWKEGKTVRLVFHAFKPLKDVEVDVVAQLVKRFPQFKIIYAFVTVSTKHPWMMYQGISEQVGHPQLTLCERGANLILDHHSCLIQLRGDSDRPNKKHRAPSPVLLRLHEKSTYIDLAYISQQALDFSFLNWRSFYPCELPVTIFYSSLMAEMSAKLQRIKGWNPVFLDQHFRRKAWYL